MYCMALKVYTCQEAASGPKTFLNIFCKLLQQNEPSPAWQWSWFQYQLTLLYSAWPRKEWPFLRRLLDQTTFLLFSVLLHKNEYIPGVLSFKIKFSSKIDPPYWTRTKLWAPCTTKKCWVSLWLALRLKGVPRVEKVHHLSLYVNVPYCMTFNTAVNLSCCVYR
jgi:hypothetical protein